MPGLLYLLRVDDYAIGHGKGEEEQHDLCSSNGRSTDSSMEGGGDSEEAEVVVKKKALSMPMGMNWGVVAVWSCERSCDENTEEFVVVQDSAEETIKD